MTSKESTSPTSFISSVPIFPKSRSLRIVTIGLLCVGRFLFQAMPAPPPITKSKSSIDSMHAILTNKYSLSLMKPQEKIRIADSNRTIAFIHIGKSGGSTISLQLRKGCFRNNMMKCKRRIDGWTPNETIASRRIQTYFHIDLANKNVSPLNVLDSFTTIVSVVRNPIERFLSAFAYSHPFLKNVTGARPMQKNSDNIYRTCFPTISSLVKAATGQHVQENNTTVNCTEMARIAFGSHDKLLTVDTGIHPWFTHMSMDYRQYYQFMDPRKELIIMRSEHLFDDWIEINKLLGAENDAYDNWPKVPPFNTNTIARNVSTGYPDAYRWRVQSQEEQMWLCELLLLHDEIHVYLMIIMRAINLSENDLSDAVKDIKMTCTV